MPGCHGVSRHAESRNFGGRGEVQEKFNREIYTEWSASEKVAFEVALAASWSGLRAAVTMKQVGLNVAPTLSSAQPTPEWSAASWLCRATTLVLTLRKPNKILVCSPSRRKSPCSILHTAETMAMLKAAFELFFFRMKKNNASETRTIAETIHQGAYSHGIILLNNMGKSILQDVSAKTPGPSSSGKGTPNISTVSCRSVYQRSPGQPRLPFCPLT